MGKGFENLLRVIICILTIFISFHVNADLKIGLTAKYPPFSYFDSKGNLTGFDVDYARELCRSLEESCNFIILPWESLVPSLLGRKIDLIISSLAITKERAREVLFSDPYYESGPVLFSNLKNLNELNESTKIGVTMGTTYESLLVNKLPIVKYYTYKSEVDIFNDIKVGRLNGIVTDKLVGKYSIQQLKIKLYETHIFDEKDLMGIALRKDDQDLFKTVNESVNLINKSNHYKNIFDKYFNRDVFVKNSLDWSYCLRILLKGAMISLVISLSGMLIGLLISFSLFVLSIYINKYFNFILVLLDIIRSTPFTIQLLGVYFGLPQFGFDFDPEIISILVIAIHSSSYITDLLIASYNALDIGQKSACQVLGFSKIFSLRYILFPQMLPTIIVPILNITVSVIKDSAIVSIISVNELTMRTQQLISSSFQAFELYILATIFYAFMTLPIIYFSRSYLKKIKLSYGK